MPYIKVDVDKLNTYQSKIYDAQKKVNTLSSSFSSVCYALSDHVKCNDNIDHKLATTSQQLAIYSAALYRMNSFIGNSALIYARVDDAQGGKGVGAGAVKDIDSILAGTGRVIGTGLDTSDSTAQAVALAAQELGISEAQIQEELKKGSFSLGDICDFLKGKADGANKFVKTANSTFKFLLGASDLSFKMKDGYVVVSKFTRDSFLNSLVQKHNDGTGIGTYYTPKTLKETPVLGTLYTVNKIATGVNIATTVVSGVAGAAGKISDVWENDDLSKGEKIAQTVDTALSATLDVSFKVAAAAGNKVAKVGTKIVSGAIDAGEKIKAINANDQLSKEEKVADIAAVAITSVVGTAMKVGAPIAGEAVEHSITAALTAAIPIPVVGTLVGKGVGIVAGKLVEGGIELVADVIMSEEVVKQTSTAIKNVGNAVASGQKAVSDAAKKVLESKNVGDAVKNTAKLVGSAVSAGAKVVATAAVETVKVAAKVVTETVKTVAKKVDNAVKSVVNFFKKW